MTIVHVIIIPAFDVSCELLKNKMKDKLIKKHKKFYPRTVGKLILIIVIKFRVFFHAK